MEDEYVRQLRGYIWSGKDLSLNGGMVYIRRSAIDVVTSPRVLPSDADKRVRDVYMRNGLRLVIEDGPELMGMILP